LEVLRHAGATRIYAKTTKEDHVAAYESPYDERLRRASE